MTTKKPSWREPDTVVAELPSESEARLQALRAILELFDSRLQLRLGQHKPALQCRVTAVRETLCALRTRRDEHKGMPPGLSDELEAGIEAIETELGTIDGAGRLTLDKRRAGLSIAQADLEGAVASLLCHQAEQPSGSWRQAVARHRKALRALEVEIEVCVACRRLLAPYRGRALQERRSELRAEVATLRAKLEAPGNQLADHRRQAARDRRSLDLELRGELDGIASALGRWLS